MRRTSVFSQALGIAVSSYLAQLGDETKLNSRWAETCVRHGYLVSFEGLLSAAGKELGMIEDASVGIEMLRNVRVMLAPDDPTTTNADRVPVVHSQHLRWVHLWSEPDSSHFMQYVLQIGVDPDYFAQRIPQVLKNGATVRFVPLLFEVGVDIFQAASNAGSNMRNNYNTATCNPDEGSKDVLSDDEDDEMGITDDDVLVQLNYEAFQKMNAYAQQVSPAQPVQATPTHQTHPLLANLFSHIVSSSGRMNHDILDEAAQFCQEFGGGGVVFCKSGKDRTAMHVTYKQSQFVHQTDASVILSAATLIRTYGTRLPICEKNVGQAKYAFNSLQVRFMPDKLKPPMNTLAGFLKGGKVFGKGGIES